MTAPALFPQISGSLAKSNGTDLYGQPRYGREQATRFSVIHIITGQEKSSVRADSSASHGRSDEPVADIHLLALPTVAVSVGDRVTINLGRFQVIAVEPRYDLFGKLAHYEFKGSRID